MPRLPSSPQLFVSVDIAAASFTAAWLGPGQTPATPRAFDQTPDGFAAFLKQLAATKLAPADTLVVLETTTSSWVALAVWLHEAGSHVSVQNPQQIHDWAKSLSRRGKSDGLDATMLTQFAFQRRPETWTPPPEVSHDLRQRLVAGGVPACG